MKSFSTPPPPSSWLFDTSQRVLLHLHQHDRVAWFFLISYINNSGTINPLMNKMGPDWNLTLKERDGYLLYFMTLFPRREDADPALLWLMQLSFNQITRLYMVSIQTLVVDMMPRLKEEVTVWRGYKSVEKKNDGEESHLAHDPLSYYEEEIVTCWSFLSCSLDRGVAARFTKGACCMLKLVLPAGTACIQVTPGWRNYKQWQPQEQLVFVQDKQEEVLLPAGTQVMITRRLKNALEGVVLGRDKVYY
jgi:hypothetical protein